MNENLTYQPSGYVFWRGRQIEHIDTYDLFVQNAPELIRRCEHLDQLGIRPSTGTVIWHWSWFEDMPVGSPWVTLLGFCPALYEHGMTAERFDEATAACCAPGPVTTPNGDVVLIVHGTPIRWDKANSKAVVLTDIKPGVGDFGGFYHVLKRYDYHSARCGQPIHNGPCYADFNGVVDWMEAHAVDPAQVLEAAGRQ